MTRGLEIRVLDVVNTRSLIGHGYESSVRSSLGNAIDSGMVLSITIDKLRVFINKTLSILSVYQ